MAGKSRNPDGEQRENILRVRLTDEERAAIDAAAKEKGLQTSTWVRMELLSLAKKGRPKKGE